MSKYFLLLSLFTLSLSLSSTPFLSALNEDIIKLPDPKYEGGMPIYQAMANRKSSRDFVDSEALDFTLEELSQLLWLGYGPNRDNGYKTVPSAVAAFPFDIYVFLRSGVYKYNPTQNQLELSVARDFRGITGSQDYVANANADLVFVGAKERESSTDDDDQKKLMMDWDSGHVAQNILLYCAANGFKCVPRAMFVESAILKVIGLTSDKYYIPLTMSTGK